MLIELGASSPEFNEPISLGCLAAALRDSRVQNIALQQRWVPLEGRLPSHLELESVDLLGVSAQIGALGVLDQLMRAVRDMSSPPVVVVGNLLPTLAPRELLNRHPEIICVRGEGERAFIEICHRWITNGPDVHNNLAGIHNVSVLRTVSGLADQIENTRLDELPIPERSFVPAVISRKGIVRIEGSRGCHWGRCEFCSVAARHGFEAWRPFPIERIVDDLAKLSAQGSRSPYFTDEDFFGRNYDRAIALASAISEAKKCGRIAADLNFYISMLASDFRSNSCRRALAALKAAGLREVFIGVEAGSREQLKRFQKKTQPDLSREALNEALRIGLQIDIGLIFFDPYMTLDDLLLNLDFVRTLPLHACDSRVVKRLRIQPYTGTVESYSDVIRGPLDLDRLTFPYEFIDERVARIWELYAEWDKPSKMKWDALMASSRGEVSDESVRVRLKEALAKVRNEDLRALTGIIEAIASGLGNRGGLVPFLENAALRKEERISAALALAESEGALTQ